MMFQPFQVVNQQVIYVLIIMINIVCMLPYVTLKYFLVCYLPYLTLGITLVCNIMMYIIQHIIII